MHKRLTTTSALYLITTQAFSVQNSNGWVLPESHWLLLSAQRKEQLYGGRTTLGTWAQGE